MEKWSFEEQTLYSKVWSKRAALKFRQQCPKPRQIWHN